MFFAALLTRTSKIMQKQTGGMWEGGWPGGGKGGGGVH